MRRHCLMAIMLGAVLTIGSIHMPVAAVENVNTADTSSQGLQQEMAETEEEQDREEPDETASEPIVSEEDASESITSEEESDVAGTEEEIAADDEDANLPEAEVDEDANLPEAEADEDANSLEAEQQIDAAEDTSNGATASEAIDSHEQTEKAAAVEPTTPEEEASGKVEFNGHTYQRFDVSKTWTEAEAYCESLGGHLVTIRSSEENGFVSELGSSGSKNCYWMGATINSQEEFEWITNESFTYSNWTRNEPDNYQNNQGYAFFFGKQRSYTNYVGEWGDISETGNSWDNVSFWGTSNYGFICEWGMDPSSFDITKATVTGISNKTYTGREIKQTPKVVFGGKTLKVGTDYTLSYKNNIKIGTATIIIKGKGDYTGTITKTFKITKISISKAKITGLKDKAYTGKAIEQTPTVTLNNKTLAKTAYTVTFSNNVKVGTATVIVKGKGNYGGTAKATFKIGYSISKASVTNIKDKTFSKTVQNSGAKQSPTVKIGNTKLKPNTDYILTYKANKETGTASVVIKGNGKYVGSVTKTFKIRLSKPSITLKSVNDGEVNCTAGTAYGATGYQFEYYKAGTSAKKSNYGSSINRVLTGLTPSATYYVRVRAYRKIGGKTFLSDYSAYKKIKVFKATKNIAKAKLSFTSPNTLWVYSGNQIKPEVVVKDGIITLRNGVDYKLDYANNTNAGTAKVIISGRGKYYGSLSKSFAIGQAGISGAVVTVIDSGLTYTSLEIEPEVTVVLGSKPLIRGKDFKVYYENNTNAGTGKVVIKGTGNYTGSCSGSFKIKSLSIDKCEVTLPNGNRYVKSDDPLEPPVVVSYKGNTIPFEPNINYELSYHIDEEEGRGKVTVSGVKNITGSKELDFDVITGFIWPTKSMRVSTLFYYSGNFERPYASHGVGNPIDIPGTIGDDIYAVQDGVVTDASYGAYGNHIYIKLEDGSQLIYGHLSKFDVKTNDKVTTGQKIGELGNTGNSKGPHLHFAWTGGNAWSEYYKQLHLTYDDSVRDANTKYYGEDSRSTEVIDWFKAHYYKNGVFQGTWVQ